MMAQTRKQCEGGKKILGLLAYFEGAHKRIGKWSKCKVNERRI